MVHFEDEAKKSMARSTMKRWSKCISMIIISKTASRNVAFTFKASRMSEFVMASQEQLKSRNLKGEVSDSQDDLQDNDKQTYNEIERNSHLYIFNQLAGYD